MMKKYISMALVAITAFAISGCSNEDIQIDQSLTVTVNPAGVIAPFTYEVNRGELSTFASAMQLRTRLLVYNDAGKAVVKQTAYLRDYNDKMTIQPNLPNGTYTMVALTDVVANGAAYEYWTLSGEEELGTMRLTAVTDNGVLRQGFKNSILGVESKKVTISEQSKTIDLNPTPAGSLICVNFKNLKKFSNIKQLQMRTNQTPDFYSFNTQGQLVGSSNRSDGSSLNGVYLRYNPQEETSESVVAYLFMMDTDITAAFAYALDGETSAHYVGGSEQGRMTKTLRRGVEYELLLDLDRTTDITTDPVFSFEEVSAK